MLRGGAEAASYTWDPPADLLTYQGGWHQTEGITASSNERLKLTITASSDWKLTSEYGEVTAYYFSDTQGGNKVTSWEFSMDELNAQGGAVKPVWVYVDAPAALRPGNYATKLFFSASYDRVPVDLSQITGAYEAQDGDVLTGTAGADAHITVAAGATITLKDAIITSIPNDQNHRWAGITCSDDATIILEGTNKVKGGYNEYPGIHVVSDDAHPNSTLTIKGAGSLETSSNGNGAGIGGGFEIACGNIVIEGGNITASGGDNAAGIGSGNMASCGTITISGGTVEATGGMYGAGIGSGSDASCGNITITDTVTSVKASKETSYANSIGAGNAGLCGTVTIGGVEGAINTDTYTYTPAKP